MRALLEEQPVVDEFRLWTSEPAFIAASIVELSNVELDRLRFWTCPCCGACKAVYAQDARGSVWLGLTIALHKHDRTVVRFDKLDEVDTAPETVPDGDLLAVVYEAGLRGDLTRLFMS